MRDDMECDDLRVSDLVPCGPLVMGSSCTGNGVE